MSDAGGVGLKWGARAHVVFCELHHRLAHGISLLVSLKSACWSAFCDTGGVRHVHANLISCSCCVSCGPGDGTCAGLLRACRADQPALLWRHPRHP